MNKKIMCIAASLFMLMTGCNSADSVEKSSSQSSSQESSLASEDTDENSEQSESSQKSEAEVNAVDFDTVPFAMSKEKCAVEIPEEFKPDDEISAVSNVLHFNGKEPDDMIAVDVFDGMTSEEFGAFDENKLFELVNYTTTLPQLQYFKEVTVENAEGISNKAYIGETLGTINGEDTYVTMLAVNCPDFDKMYVLSMRDKTGEYQNYRDNLNKYLYINENGYTVENGQLKDAPEPEPVTHINSEIGYTINLPEGWGLVEDMTGIYGLERMTNQYEDFDLFMNDERDVAFIAATDADVSEQVFYSSMKEAAERSTSSGGNELVSSRECEIGGYSAYQVVVNHTAGADPTRSTSWFINVTGENPHIIAIRYQYREDGAEFADKLINSITIE